jgi:hypothetical protein
LFLLISFCIYLQSLSDILPDKTISMHGFFFFNINLSNKIWNENADKTFIWWYFVSFIFVLHYNY